MSAKTRASTSSGKAAPVSRPAAAEPSTAGSVTELRARLQDALDELEEQRAHAEELKTAMAAALERAAALEAAEADRLRGTSHSDNAVLYVEEIDALRRERSLLAQCARSDEGRRLANLEKRLRTTEATLAQTLQALEEHRIAAVEHQMMAEAAEHHAAEIEQESRRRVQHADTVVAANKAELEAALQLSEERRIAAAEMQTILDATEHRLTQLQHERDTLAQDHAAWAAERGEVERQLGDLRVQAEQLKAERASTTTALERTMAELALQRDIAAGLGIERDAAIEHADKHTQAAAQLEQTIATLRARSEEVEAALRGATEELDGTRAELTAREATLTEIRAGLDHERATCTQLAAELETATNTVTERDRALQALEVERNTLAETRQALAQQLEQLRAHASEVEGQLSDAAKGLADVRGAHERETATRSALEQQLASAHAQLTEQRQQAEVHTAQIEELTRQLTASRAHAEHVQAELQRSSGELEEQRRAGAAAASEHHAVAQHLREVQDALARREHDLEELHGTLARERDAWTAARGELLASLEREGGAQQELVAARHALEERLHAIETERDVERERGARLNEERAQLATAIALVREELQTQMDAVSALSTEHDALQARLRVSEAAAAETAQQLSERVANHTRERAQWDSARAERDTALTAARGQLNALTTERDRLNAAVEQERAARLQVEAQRTQFGNEKASLATQLADATAQLDTLRTSLRDAQDQGSQSGERVGQLEAELKRLQQQLDEAHARHEKLAQEQAQRQQALESARAASDAARAAAVDAATKAQAGHEEAQRRLHAEIERLRGEVQDRTAAAERNERSLQDVRQKGGELERKLAEAQQAREAAIRAQSQLTESLRAAADQRTALERRVAELEKARDVVVRDHAKATQSLRATGEQRAALEATLSDLQEQHAALTQERERLTGTLSGEREQRSGLERQIAELSQVREAAVRAHAQLTESLHEERDRRMALERQVAQLEQVRADTTRQQEELQNTLRAEGNKRGTLERQVAELEQARIDATRKHGQLQEALQAEGRQRRDLEGQLAELRRAQAAAAKEREDLIESARRTAEQQSALERQLQSAAAEKTQLQSEIGRLSEARTALQQHLQEAQAQLTAEQAAARELRDLQSHGTELYQLVEAELEQTRSAKEAAIAQVEAMTAALDERGRDLARLQATLADAQQKEREVQARHEQARAELQSLAHTRDELQARVQALGDRDKLAARTAELERLVAQSEQQGDALRKQLTETQDQLHEAMQRVATVATTAADVSALRTEMAERERESERLRQQVENLSEQRDVLQRERDQLKRRAQDADDVERVRAEQERLLEKITEAERQQAEATQRHSAAVSGYMVELNQRSELLRQRELQIEKLSEELRMVQQACEDGVSQVAGLRQERELLELRVRELESAAQAPRPAAKVPAGEGLRLATSEASAAPAQDKVDKAAPPSKAAFKAPASPGQAKAAPAPPAAKPAQSPAAAAAGDIAPSTGKGLKPSRNASGVLNVVHLEDIVPLRDAMRSAVSRFARVKYTTAQDAPATVQPPTLLAINLLVKSIDPLVTMVHADAWGVQPPQAFAYCADGTRGTVIGLADFFPHPFDISACAARINARTGGTQRLLVVGESVELLNEIRSTMNKIRCSTSVALDARQAFDLVGMVKPQMVLVDVGLQRAEGLRLISRLRSDPAYASVGIGLMWTRDLDANDFRTQVARAVRDYSFPLDELGRAMANLVAELGFANEPLRDAG